MTVLTVGVCPATFTTDGNVAATDGGTACDTATPFVCADEVLSAAVDCAGTVGGTAAGLVPAAAAAATGAVDGWVPKTQAGLADSHHKLNEMCIGSQQTRQPFKRNDNKSNFSQT